MKIWPSYAYYLGLTFQIVDDILDIVGDPEELGKPVGTDLLQGRGVLVAQQGLAGIDGDGSATAVAEAVSQDPIDPIQQMMANLRESGAVEIARMQAKEMGRRAQNALNTVPPSPARTELFSLVDTVLKRHN